MDLPSAADKLVDQLKKLNVSTAEIPIKLNKIADAIIQPMDERIGQLEAEIHGNAYRDFIRQEVQNHNDRVLDHKIHELSTQFQTGLQCLEARIAAIEHWHSQANLQDNPVETESSTTDIDEVSNSDDEINSNTTI
jgi:hypothetical protein